jgi:predicted nucleic acid-binding protein
VILVDAGPLVAIADADDQHHAVCSAALKSIRLPLCTVWPVLAEAMHLLNDLPQGQDVVWEMVVRATVQIVPLGSDDVPRIRELMRQYADLPMDLADAALIRVGERERIHEFFTIDRKDFSVYRMHGTLRPRILP